MSESDSAGSPDSQRYELEELFEGEAPELLHLFRIIGEVVLVALLLLAFIYVLGQL